jgi:nitrogen fixation protein FixH
VSALRYLIFAVVGLVIAVVLFFALNVAITVTDDARTGAIERWIVRATCDRYALSGSVRDPQGAPVAFATVEAVYLDQRLTTRSREDGRFQLSARRKDCAERPDVVSVYVTADAFRAKRRVLRFDEDTLDVVLDRADF